MLGKGSQINIAVVIEIGFQKPCEEAQGRITNYKAENATIKKSCNTAKAGQTAKSKGGGDAPNPKKPKANKGKPKK